MSAISTSTKDTIQNKDKFIFDAKASEQYICIICHSICTDPVGCESQGHLMCQPCATAVIENKQCCPMKCNGDKILTVNKDHRARREIDSLMVECIDCKKKFTYSSTRSHPNFCIGIDYKCNIPNCTFKSNKVDMELHLSGSSDAVNKRHLNCYNSLVQDLRLLVKNVELLENGIIVNNNKNNNLNNNKKRKFNQYNHYSIKDYKDDKHNSCNDLKDIKNISDSKDTKDIRSNKDDTKNIFKIKSSQEIFIDKYILDHKNESTKPLLKQAAILEWKTKGKDEKQIYIKESVKLRIQQRVQQFAGMGFDRDICERIIKKERKSKNMALHIFKEQIKRLLLSPK